MNIVILKNSVSFIPRLFCSFASLVSSSSSLHSRSHSAENEFCRNKQGCVRDDLSRPEKINTAIPSLHCLRLFRFCLSTEWTANSKHWLTARRWSEREDRCGPNDFLFLSFFRIEKFTMVGVDVKGVLVCDKSGLTLTSNDRNLFHSAALMISSSERCF